MSERVLRAHTGVYEVILLTDEAVDIGPVEEHGSSVSELLHDSYALTKDDAIDGGLVTFYDGASSEFYVGSQLDSQTQTEKE